MILTYTKLINNHVKQKCYAINVFFLTLQETPLLTYTTMIINYLIQIIVH